MNIHVLYIHSCTCSRCFFGFCLSYIQDLNNQLYLVTFKLFLTYLVPSEE